MNEFTIFIIYNILHKCLDCKNADLEYTNILIELIKNGRINYGISWWDSISALIWNYCTCLFKTTFTHGNFSTQIGSQSCFPAQAQIKKLHARFFLSLIAIAVKKKYTLKKTFMCKCNINTCLLILQPFIVIMQHLDDLCNSLKTTYSRKSYLIAETPIVQRI